MPQIARTCITSAQVTLLLADLRKQLKQAVRDKADVAVVLNRPVQGIVPKCGWRVGGWRQYKPGPNLTITIDIRGLID